VGTPGDDLVGRGADLGAGRRRLPRRDASWTIDAPNGYQQNAFGTLPVSRSPAESELLTMLSPRLTPIDKSKNIEIIMS
jgi:hypothetical protein